MNHNSGVSQLAHMFPGKGKIKLTLVSKLLKTNYFADDIHLLSRGDSGDLPGKSIQSIVEIA